MKYIVLNLTAFLIGSSLVVAGCSDDDDDDDASAGTGGMSGTGGLGGTASGGTSGGGNTGGGGTGTGGASGAGGSSNVGPDCIRMCENGAECAAGGAGGAAGASAGGAAGLGGAAGEAGGSGSDPDLVACLDSCDFFAETVPNEPCRAELEAYFACAGSIEPDETSCVGGMIDWDMYCTAELAAAEACQS